MNLFKNMAVTFLGNFLFCLFFLMSNSSLSVASDSLLFSLPQKVQEGIYSAIGETGPPSYENSGHNNNLSFIITDDGVVVINASATYLLAKSLHTEIKKLTDQPVKYVILENAQGHAAMGSKYWKDQGAEIIAHIEAADEIEHNAGPLQEQTKRRLKEKADGSEAIRPDTTFEDKLVLELGGEVIEIINFGPAHSPGDISVWLPERSLIIAGDMAFHQRLLAIFEDTDTAAWLESWEGFAALNAKYVIPGHGVPTNMAEVTTNTKEYLIYLRQKVGDLLEKDGTLEEAYYIDQSEYSHLNTFDELAKKNAGQVFVQMEFE